MKKFLSLLMVIAIMVCATACSDGAGSPESVVKSYIRAVNDADADGFVELMHPDYVDYICDEMDADLDELKENLKRNFEDVEDYDAKITGVNKFDEDDLEDLKEWYEDELGLKVKDARAVTIEVDEDGYEYEETYSVVKIGTKWYLGK